MPLNYKIRLLKHIFTHTWFDEDISGAHNHIDNGKHTLTIISTFTSSFVKSLWNNFPKKGPSSYIKRNYN